MRASAITDRMEVAAGHAIAATIGEQELAPDYIMPSVFNRGVVPAAAATAEQDGVTRSSREAAESAASL